MYVVVLRKSTRTLSHNRTSSSSLSFKRASHPTASNQPKGDGVECVVCVSFVFYLFFLFNVFAFNWMLTARQLLALAKMVRVRARLYMRCVTHLMCALGPENSENSAAATSYKHVTTAAWKKGALSCCANERCRNDNTNMEPRSVVRVCVCCVCAKRDDTTTHRHKWTAAEKSFARRK